LWSAIIPVLPAAFLVNVQLWRNVCPLATLTLLPGDKRGSRRLSEGAVRAAGVAGVLLLVILVPARRMLFNVDGPVLALTVAAVGVLALCAGLAYERKAGFCNAICPVLPVERLYGQRPLVRVPHVRCATCTQCTERGCIDLSYAGSVRTALGPQRLTGGWMLSPFGAFASSFPGFIVGYYTTTNVPPAGTLAVYGHVLQSMALSFLVVAVLARVFRIGARLGVILLGATAAALYYWFAARAVTDTWGFSEMATWTIRALALALVGFWLRRAIPASPVVSTANESASQRSALPVAD
jgi:nitrite reductase (NADH) large subunit